MQVVRHTLLDGELLRLSHVVARPSPLRSDGIQSQTRNAVVLPLSGVFAKHDGPRRHTVATPNHAILISAGSPYRISYPGGIGDQCLTFWISSAALAHVLPQVMSRDGFDPSAFESAALLPPAVILTRGLLWRLVVSGELDPLEIEELGIGLLVSALRATCKKRHGWRNGADRDSGRRARHVECVKEAVSLQPGRKWTLAELARLVHVSPFHLSHVFRRDAGVTLYQYVLRTRLVGALDAVLGASGDLTRIALESGFSSHSHFTARFHAMFGLTPIELRRCASAARVAQLRNRVTASAVPAE